MMGTLNRRATDKPFMGQVPPRDSVENFGFGDLKNLCDGFPLGIVLCDDENRCLYSNRAFQEIIDCDAEEILGHNWRHSIHEKDRQELDGSWISSIVNRTFLQQDVRLIRADDKVIWVRIRAMIMEDPSKHSFSSSLLMFEDLSKKQAMQTSLAEMEKTLLEEKQRCSITLDHIGDGVITTDLDGNVVTINIEAEQLTVWDRQEAIGKPASAVFNVIDSETREKTNPAIIAINENRCVTLSMGSVLITHDGNEIEIEDSAFPLHNQQDEMIGAAIIFHHISKSSTVMEKTSRLAWYDHLTGLPNLAMFNECISQSISMAQRHSKRVALLFLDMDDFKAVNDTFGHMFGDKILQSVAVRLTDCVRTSDTVCRRSGDEFLILLGEIGHADDAILVAQEILKSIAMPHKVQGQTLSIAASIGISVFPEDAQNVTSLMKSADTAMYTAKQSGPNRYYCSGALSS